MFFILLGMLIIFVVGGGFGAVMLYGKVKKHFMEKRGMNKYDAEIPALGATAVIIGIGMVMLGGIIHVI